MEATPPQLTFEADDSSRKVFSVVTNVENWLHSIKYINGNGWILERVGVDLLELSVDENTGITKKESWNRCTTMTAR